MSFLPGMFPAVFAAAGGGTPAETGFTLVGAGATVNTGGNAWGNPGNITADDGSNAIAPISTFTEPLSQTLRGSDLGFSIPGGATIDGIEIRLQLSAQIFSGIPTINSVNIAKDNSTLGTAKTPGTTLTATPTNYDFGNASDLWGLSWTAAEINASTFQGLLIVLQTGSGSANAFCDAMWINVHYTA